VRRTQQESLLTVRAIDSVSNLSGVMVFSSLSANVAFTSQWLRNTAACPVWADISAMWDECRIESIRVCGMPPNRYVGSQDDVMVMGLDADGITSGGMTSLPVAASYTTSRMLGCSEPFDITWEVPQPAAKPWFNIADIGNGRGSDAPQAMLFLMGNASPWTGVISTNTILFRIILEFKIRVRGVRQ